MDLLIALLLFVAAASGGILGNMIASELYDDAPIVARWLIERGARQLPSRDRERFREEWLAHVDECPGHLSKLRHALDCYLRAARKITAELQASQSNVSEDGAEKVAAAIAKFALRIILARHLIPFAIRNPSTVRAWPLATQIFWKMTGVMIDQTFAYAKKYNANSQQMAEYMTRWMQDYARAVRESDKERPMARVN